MITMATPLGAVLELEPLDEKDNTFTAEKVRGMGEWLGKQVDRVPMLGRGDVREGIVRELIEGLRSPVLDVLAEAWNARQEIREYADPSRHPHDETHQVTLLKHSIAQKVTASVEVRSGEMVLGKVTLEGEVRLTLDGARLVIRGGMLTHLRPGEIKGEVELSAGPATLWRAETKPRQLPGEIRLGEGIRIPPPKAA